MKSIPLLKSDRIYLRQLAIEDASSTYASWLNDPIVNRFLEIRHHYHSTESCRQFIKSMNDDPASYLYGIFIHENDIHIGNIKIGFVNKYYDSGEISLLIGNKNYWGKGYATEAIRLVTGHAFNHLGLWRLEAGCYSENFSSLKAFMKAGFTIEGFFRKSVLLEGKRQGCFWLGVIKDEWE